MTELTEPPGCESADKQVLQVSGGPGVLPPNAPPNLGRGLPALPAPLRAPPSRSRIPAMRCSWGARKAGVPGVPGWTSGPGACTLRCASPSGHRCCPCASSWLTRRWSKCGAGACPAAPRGELSARGGRGTTPATVPCHSGERGGRAGAEPRHARDTCPCPAEPPRARDTCPCPAEPRGAVQPCPAEPPRARDTSPPPPRAPTAPLSPSGLVTPVSLPSPAPRRRPRSPGRRLSGGRGAAAPSTSGRR